MNEIFLERGVNTTNQPTNQPFYSELCLLADIMADDSHDTTNLSPDLKIKGVHS